MIVGLTGGIGSGKTTVAALLGSKGAVVIDTDLIAREVVRPPSPVLESIRGEFGASVLGPDGMLDRNALARVIFADDRKRARLNQLMHPEILKRVLNMVGAQPANAIVVVVVPLLFESNFESNCDRVIAVVAPPDVRRQRIAERDGLTGSEIEARMRTQLPDAEYERRATIVVRNDHNLTALGREVEKAWKELTDQNQARRPGVGKP
jgi:dephospho-CoA kinase